MNFKKLENLLPLVFLPTLVQLLLNMSVDPWTTARVRFLIFSLANYHQVTWFVLICVSISVYMLLHKHNILTRISISGLLTYTAIETYEIYWHIANAFRTHDLYILSFEFWTNEFVVFWYFSVALLAVVYFKKKPCTIRITKAFIALACLEFVLFAFQVVYNFDWSSEGIPTNAPFLWAATKVVGYGMFIALIEAQKLHFPLLKSL